MTLEAHKSTKNFFLKMQFKEDPLALYLTHMATLNKRDRPTVDHARNKQVEEVRGFWGVRVWMHFYECCSTDSSSSSMSGALFSSLDWVVPVFELSVSVGDQVPDLL